MIPVHHLHGHRLFQSYCNLLYIFNPKNQYIKMDCCYDQNCDMLLLVAAQNVFPAVMRERFFPDTPPESILEVYRFSKGRLICRTEICRSRDTELATGFNGFFHTAASGAVYLIWCKNMDRPGDSTAQGTYLTPAADLAAPPIRLMDETGWLFGSKTRLGAFPSDTVDLYWPRLDRDIMHASFELSTYIK